MSQRSRREGEPLDMELAEIGRSISSSFRIPGASYGRSSSIGSLRVDDDDEHELAWAAIERLPTLERVRTSMFDHTGTNENCDGKDPRKPIDVTKLGALDRRLLIEKIIKHIENDNLRHRGALQEFVCRSKVPSGGREAPPNFVEYRYMHIVQLTEESIFKNEHMI